GVNISFHTQPPVQYKQKKKIDFDFYCGVCSDSSGQLKFYTNGISIRNATHNLMQNGDTINPGFLWELQQNTAYPQGPFAHVLPAPGRKNHYYLFHMASQITTALISSPYYWTLIDMNANNGLGRVVKKNQMLIPDGDLVAPVAVKHGNGRDWWVITGLLGTPKIFTFLVNPDGVHGPFEYEMPFDFPGDEYQSVNAMSPDGNTYIRCDGYNGLNIFDFDRCTGQLHNLRWLPFADPNLFVFATVFAPDSKTLYLSSWKSVMSLDLSAPDVAATLDTLAYFDGQPSPQEPFTTGFWNPCLAPDGKIYYATTNSTLAMHLIHDPGQPGQAADVQQHGLALTSYNNGTMCLFPNYRLGEWEGSPCDTVNGQKPGDGFTKTPYAPPPVRSGGYSVLPALGKPAPPGSPAPPRRPSMAELAREQRKAGEATTNQQLRTKE
ncbi:MAG TPA: hypothetical protein PKD78_12435, partial [Saprospiraceae bacterium]|nr:hypothetical protein [Saprospiraceae bacterium]